MDSPTFVGVFAGLALPLLHNLVTSFTGCFLSLEKSQVL